LTVSFIVGLVQSNPTRVALEADVPLSKFSAGWVMGPRASPTAPFQLTVALTQSNLDKLTTTLLAAADPSDAEHYGKWLSKEEVDAMLAPPASAVASVERVLESYGICLQQCETSANSDVIRCSTTVAAAEALLDTEFHHWMHAEQPEVQVMRAAAKHYTLPAEVAAVVDLVSPTLRFPSLGFATLPATSNNTEPLIINTPKSLRKLYSVGDVEGSAPSNKLACTAFLKQHFKVKDLNEFWSLYYPKAKGRTIKVIGDDSGLGAGVEASLDIEYITAMGGGIEAEFWTYNGTAPDNKQNEPFLDWILQVGNTSDAEVPLVFSTSYGEPEDSVTMAYMNRIESEFKKTGVRGITLLFASGDSGVGGKCTNNRLVGNWPAGSPWVTGVGGTEGSGPAKAWTGSSGGFSDRWEQPSWQKDAIAMYLKTATNLPGASWFNGTSRGFPDVSAQSTGYLVIADGLPEPVAGTSCASPTFSGVFALLNDLRLQNNKTTLGWVNPFFYKNPTMFTDITTGSNGAGVDCGGKGFPAVAGWDPVTGLGVPNYPAMAKAVLALP